MPHVDTKTATKIQLYGITIKYNLGPKVPVADTLSRVNCRGNTPIKGLDVTIHGITPQPIMHIKVHEIHQATKKDQTIQLLMQQLMEGWPEHHKRLQPFWCIRNDLAIEHSCPTFQGRIYIPSSMRKKHLQALHQGYPGTVKMKLRAQSSMYWIGLNKEIENHVI